MRVASPRLTTLVIAASVVLGLAACSEAGAKGKAAKGAPTFVDGGISMGNPNAKVKVVEFASASCSHCARFDAEVFPAFKAKYIDTGRISYTFKEFLTQPEQYAAGAFLLARCAGPAKYFSVVEGAFRGQTEMFATQDMRTPLLKVAQSAGMNEDQFKACVSDQVQLKALSDRIDHAQTVDKITGTPTFIVNGVTVASGEVTLAQLDAAIAAAQAKK